MRDFTYHEPNTVNEAALLLKEFKNDARIKAGGTDLLVKMKKEMINAKHLINLKNIQELAYIDYHPKIGLKIGSMTTLDEIERSAIIKERFKLLWQAASRVASQQIRNEATIGGNICLDSRCQYYNQSRRWLDYLDSCYKRGGSRCYVSKDGRKCYSIFSADTVPALIALDARVKLMDSEKEKVMSLEKVYTGVGVKVNKIQNDEILTEIQIPEADRETLTFYLKESERGEVDFPIIGIATTICLAGNNTFDNVNMVIIGTGPSPIRLLKIGEMLKGQKCDPKTIQKVCEEVVHTIGPISNVFGLGEYKNRTLPSLMASSILEAVSSKVTIN